jgi:hypothetical protein
MLSTRLPSLARNATRTACRSRRALGIWANPPAANLVPIVIEQTVRVPPCLRSPSFNTYEFRAVESAPTTSSRVSSASASSCSTDPCVHPLSQGLCRTEHGHPQIHDNDSALTVAQLLFLEAEDSSKPIHLYINSPGGSVTAGLAIYDTVSAPPIFLCSLLMPVSTDAGLNLCTAMLLC